MNWFPIELHTHTMHSDGDFTVDELVKAAKQRGFCAVACTDHNTVSALPELERAVKQEDFIGIPGIEWTTYWGHMLVLNELGYTDWRGVKKEEIDSAITSIHRNHGMVGIAHPFALSNPINTGYSWEFQVSDWGAVDFLEVWSRDHAPSKIQSLRAMQLWEQLLNRGYRITATSGRDWHREDALPYTHTYVGANGELTAEKIQQAVQCGKVCLSAGPLLTMQTKNAEIGDTIAAGKTEFVLHVDFDTMPNDWNQEQVLAEEICLVANGIVVWRCPVEERLRIETFVSKGWIRADLMGKYEGRSNQRLAFTNPFFVQ